MPPPAKIFILPIIFNVYSKFFRGANQIHKFMNKKNNNYKNSNFIFQKPKKMDPIDKQKQSEYTLDKHEYWTTTSLVVWIAIGVVLGSMIGVGFGIYKNGRLDMVMKSMDNHEARWSDFNYAQKHIDSDVSLKIANEIHALKNRGYFSKCHTETEAGVQFPEGIKFHGEPKMMVSQTAITVTLSGKDKKTGKFEGPVDDPVKLNNVGGEWLTYDVEVKGPTGSELCVLFVDTG
jgi:hypothetical protein